MYSRRCRQHSITPFFLGGVLTSGRLHLQCVACIALCIRPRFAARMQISKSADQRMHASQIGQLLLGHPTAVRPCQSAAVWVDPHDRKVHRPSLLMCILLLLSHVAGTQSSVCAAATHVLLFAHVCRCCTFAYCISPVLLCDQPIFCPTVEVIPPYFVLLRMSQLYWGCEWLQS